MEQVISIVKGIDLEKLIIGVLVLVICLVVSRILMRLFSRLLKRVNHIIDTSLHSMLKTTLRIVLYFISIVFAANTMGIPVTSFLALFSVVGLAVSLAVQGVLSNLAGGVIILASKPFTLGDFIETDTVTGTVKDIGFLNTRMVSPDGKMIHVPNSLLHSSKLINYSSSGKRRIDILVNMSFHASPENVRTAAMEAIGSVKGILSDPAPEVLLENYADSAVQYTVRVWAQAQDFLTVRYALNEALFTAFRKHELEFTYPHINVHMQ